MSRPRRPVIRPIIVVQDECRFVQDPTEWYLHYITAARQPGMPQSVRDDAHSDWCNQAGVSHVNGELHVVFDWDGESMGRSVKICPGMDLAYVAPNNSPGIYATHFRGRDLSKSDFKCARFVECNFLGCDLTGVNIDRTEFIRCYFDKSAEVAESPSFIECTFV